jgi:hypothetical protein
MRYLLILWLLSLNAIANNSSTSMGLQLPSMGTSYASDKFRAGNLDCSNAIGGSTNLEFGMTGIVNNAQSPFSSDDSNNPTTKDIGLYARIVIPLDPPKERINCNTLYQLELRKKRLEVLKLEEELNALRRLQLENKFEN